MSNLRRLLGLLSLFLLAGCSLFFPRSAPSLPQVWSGTTVPTAVATLSVENASQVVEIARWGKGSISDLAWSPDGQQLAVSTSTGIFLYDAETCQQVKYIPTRYGATHLAYSSDGKTLAIGDEFPGDDAHILDATTGQEIQNLRGSAFVSGLAFLPDSKSLVVAGGNNSIEVWDVNTGWKRKALEDVRVFSSAELAVSPDKNILAAADMETVWLWDLKSGQHLQSLTPKGMATLVSFSPDGKFLATDACGERADQTICTAGEIWLWDTTTWKPVTTLKGNQGWLESIDFSPDGTMLASGGSHDHSLKLWDVKTGQMLRTIDEFTAPVSDVAFSPDGKQIASASRDTGVIVWSTDTYEQLCHLDDYTDSIGNISLSKDGSLIAAGSRYGARLRETTRGNQQQVFTGDEGSIVRGKAAIAPAANILAYGNSKHGVQVWQLGTGEEEQFPEVPADVRDLTFSPDGSLIAAGLMKSPWTSHDPIWLWNSHTGETVGTLPAKFDADSIAFSPDGKLLAVGTEEEQPIRIWDIASKQEVRSMDGEVGAVTSIAFSSDGKVLAASSYDGIVRLWDVATGRKLHDLSGHTWWVYSVAFSPDGKLLVSGSRDQTIRLWNVATGKELKVLEGHTNGVTGLAFLPDSTYLISGSDDGSMRVWGIPAETPQK